ncbi:MAG: ABC transporter permease [Actinomycetota bacterium]|nr:ABC transporter permease [Actinomycetota bacterium]
MIRPVVQQRSPFWLLVTSFFQREVRARYKRSLLGWMWSLINPLSTVLIYSIVFGVFLRTAPPTTKNASAELFAVYLFAGLVGWNLFANVVNGSMDWLAGVMDLRKKVFFPTETAILGGTLATLVQTLFEVAVLLAIMLALGNISFTFLLFFPILLGVASFGLGIGLVISVLNARFRDVRYLTGIALSLQFFLVPIVYPIGLLDGPDIDTYGLPARELVAWNPVSQFVQGAHDVVYFLEVPSLGRCLAMIGYAVVSPTIGLWYFRKRSMAISEEL